MIRKSHKQWVSEIFDRVAPRYGENGCSYYTYFGKRLVEQAKITLNQCVLDVASGRGAVLFPATEAVGAHGKIVGIDISQQMLNETAKELNERQIVWAELHKMDAEDLRFPDQYFDFVFCSFALYFFPSIAKALAEFKRVLKPGGTLAVSTFGTLGNDFDLQEFCLYNWLYTEANKDYKLDSIVATPLWSKIELQKYLEEAAFKNIQISSETKRFSHRSVEAWWDELWNHGTREIFEQLNEDQLADLRSKTIEKANSEIKGKVINEDISVYFGIATKE